MAMSVNRVTLAKFARVFLRQKGPVQSFSFSFKEMLLTSLEEAKGTLLEGMARQMSEKDVKKMAKYWKFDFSVEDEEGSKFPPSSTAVHVEKEDIALPSAIVVEKDGQSNDYFSAHRFGNVNLLHPVLGELLIDLGYKRTYVTSVKNLLMAPIWEKQRILRPERARQIAEEKIVNKSSSKLPGVITFFEDASSGQVGIIDGQHRSAALIFLAQKGSWNEWSRNILVDVFTTHGDEEISALFNEINSAQPVRLVDMPGIADDTVKIMLDEATSSLAAKYSELFKTSAACKPPHLNVDVFRDDLFQSNFVKRFAVVEGQVLLSKLEEVNNKLGDISDGDWWRWRDGEPVKAASQFKLRNTGKSFASALSKARQHKFFLGLVDKSWMFADD